MVDDVFPFDPSPFRVSRGYEEMKAEFAYEEKYCFDVECFYNAFCATLLLFRTREIRL